MMRPPPKRQDELDPLAMPPPDDGSVSPEEMLGNVDDSPDAGYPDEDDEGMEPDMDAMMSELGDAEAAGEQYAADAMFAPVPGAEEPAADVGVQAQAELTPEQLQELLQALKSQ